jgi:hypothetical protein
MIKLKTEVNKSALMRELKQQAVDIYENSSDPYDKVQAFMAGAESFFDLLRLPVVMQQLSCDGCKYKGNDDSLCGDCGDDYRNKTT